MNNENPIMFIPLQPKPHPPPAIECFRVEVEKTHVKNSTFVSLRAKCH